MTGEAKAQLDLTGVCLTCMLLTVAFLAVGLAAHGVKPAGMNSARLTVTVEDPGSDPIAGASVTLVSVNGVLRTDTLLDGSFVFNNIDPGAYQIEVAVRGFIREKLSVNVQDSAAPPPVVIRPGLCDYPEPTKWCSHFPVSYGPPNATDSHLEGVVYRLGGAAPIANAEIKIKRIDGAQPPMRCRSDQTGKFFFEDVAAGIYDLRVAKRGYEPAEVKRMIKPRGHSVFIETSILERGVVLLQQ